MATRSIHCKLGVVDQFGNIVTISPKTTGDDVYIRENQFKKGTTLQALVNNLGNIAFTNDFAGISDSDTNNSYKTWSANKISKDVYDISLINSKKASDFRSWCNTIIASINRDEVVATREDNITALCNKIQEIYNIEKDKGVIYYTSYYRKGNAVKAEGLESKSWVNSSGIVLSGGVKEKGSVTRYLQPGETLNVTEDGYYPSVNINAVKGSALSKTVSNITMYSGSANTGTFTGTIKFTIPSAVANHITVHSIGLSDVMFTATATTGPAGDEPDERHIRVDIESVNIVLNTDLNRTTSITELAFNCNIEYLIDTELPSDTRTRLIFNGLFDLIYTYY